MRILLRQSTLHTRRVLAEHGFGDLRPMHLLVLERLHHSPVRATALAETLGLTKQATGQIVDRMELFGYVARVRDPNDGRAKLVELADRGRQAADTLRVVAEDTDQRWSKTLGELRYRQLRTALGTLISTTDV